MNGRILDGATPEERIAALFRSVLHHYAVPVPNVPDYADIEVLIRPFVELEIWRAVEAYIASPMPLAVVQQQINNLRRECLLRHF